MGREEANESKSPLTGDVITQHELASQLIFQNAEYPARASILERFKNGARIEPGPLTIVHSFVDIGPFIIHASEATRRAEQVRQSIRAATRALDEINEPDSISEFRQASLQLTARVWEAVMERRKASLEARNWAGFQARVWDRVYACQVTWMIWACTHCVRYGFKRLGREAFGIASSRAYVLAAVSL